MKDSIIQELNRLHFDVIVIMNGITYKPEVDDLIFKILKLIMGQKRKIHRSDLLSLPVNLPELLSSLKDFKQYLSKLDLYPK